VRLLPVDSEHSAIFQCLHAGGRPCACSGGSWSTPGVRRLILTASGGPFEAQPDVDLGRVSVEQALRHPRWRMGRKVTVDSATLMNKGLEIMEAHWLFGVPVDRIQVLVHPESIVHSLVEFADRSMLAQMSVPDMRFAIQYALTYPDRVETDLPALNLARAETLHFSEPDARRFPCLDLARAAAKTGGTMPAVLNAANEVAVDLFLGGRLSFPGIWGTVERVMQRHEVIESPLLNDIIAADLWARRMAKEAG
jgi:1-deoxy-D-xylulose-5-phosphate reductoisomerase